MAALVMTAAGTASLFVYSAAINLCLAAFTILRVAFAVSPPNQTHERFEPMPEQSSPTALELDPRGQKAILPSP